MIWLDLTDLPDPFPSFSLISSSEEREQLTKEIDLTYQESLKADKLTTVTSKEEDYNTINFDPGVDVIEKRTTKLHEYVMQDVKECFQNPVLLRNSLSFQ